MEESVLLILETTYKESEHVILAQMVRGQQDLQTAVEKRRDESDNYCGV